MTRDELVNKVNYIAEFTKIDEHMYEKLQQIKKHDAEQRQRIEQLRKELALLKQDDAERCLLIRDMEEEERRKDREIEQARRTAEYWKAEHLAGNKKIEQQAQQIATLREALQLLHDYQNGCPLPSYEEGWTRAMALTCEALKEHS